MTDELVVDLKDTVLHGYEQEIAYAMLNGDYDEAKALSTRARKGLSSTSFVYPKERRYPIHDRAHAANALARSSGKPEEAKVRAAVCRRYPDMPACKRKSSQNRAMGS